MEKTSKKSKNDNKSKIPRKEETEITAPEATLAYFAGFPPYCKVSKVHKIFGLRPKNLKIQCDKYEFPLPPKSKKSRQPLSTTNLNIKVPELILRDPLSAIFDFKMDFFLNGNGLLRHNRSLFFISINHNLIKRGQIFTQFDIIDFCFEVTANFCLLICKGHTGLEYFWVNSSYRIIHRGPLSMISGENTISAMTHSRLRRRHVLLLLNDDRVVKVQMGEGAKSCQLAYPEKEEPGDSYNKIFELNYRENSFLIVDEKREKASIQVLDFEKGRLNLFNYGQGESKLQYYDPKDCYSVNFAFVEKVGNPKKDIFVTYSPHGVKSEKNRIKWLQINKTLFNFMLEKKKKEESIECLNSGEDSRLFDLFKIKAKAKPHLKYLDHLKIIGETPYFLSEFWALCAYN